MTVVEKIVALRAAMEAERADGVYVPSSDPHMTEYCRPAGAAVRGCRALRVRRERCV